MSKATLTFDLPDERDDHLLAVKASNIYGALWDVGQYLRQIDRYMEVKPGIEEIRERFYEIIEENGFNLEEIS